MPKSTSNDKECKKKKRHKKLQFMICEDGLLTFEII